MKTILIILFIALFEITNAQTPNWVWAKNAGGSSYERVDALITDAFGNVFTAGDFASSSINFGSTSLNNAGGDDMFLVKYDPNGNVLWAKSSGGSFSDRPEAIATDANDNILVAGYFYSNSITFGSFTLYNSGGSDLFVVKYDTNGNVLWARRAGGTKSINPHELAFGVASDAYDNVYVTGSFSSSFITFGAITLFNVSGGGYGSHADMFLVKYDPNGNVIWAKSTGGTDFNTSGNKVAVDPNNDVYVTGYFSSNSISFGSTTLINANNTGHTNDLFLAKYDANGNVLWAKSAGGTGNEQASPIVFDVLGKVYVGGNFSSSNITFETTTLTNTYTGSSDLFIVKFDTNGNVLWANSYGGSGTEYASSADIDATGNVFLTGEFNSSTITFGSNSLTNSNAGSFDIYVVKFDSNGNVLWAIPAGDIGYEYANSVATDAFGSVFLGGEFNSPTITFGTTTLSKYGTSDMFVAKLDVLTGLHELSHENSISIYPNPTQDVLNIDLKENFIISEMRISIIDLGGKIIVPKVISNSNSSFKINTSFLSSGKYLLKIEEDTSTKYLKFIKQ